MSRPNLAKSITAVVKCCLWKIPSSLDGGSFLKITVQVTESSIIFSKETCGGERLFQTALF